MNGDSEILIHAKDCSQFINQNGHSDAIQFFIANSVKWNMFSFKKNLEDYDVSEIAYFNNNDAKWYAGRFIGEATFVCNGQQYRIRIEPRFGLKQLFRMLEQVFNIRLSDSKSLVNNDANFQFLIKKIISFLWLHLLAKANNHGLPRHTVIKQHKGSTIKGKLDIRKSIRPLYTEQQLVSTYREKELNNTIANILSKAFMIMKKEYEIGYLNFPANAKEAIEQLPLSDFQKHIPDIEYRKIAYKDIYLSYKPVVDLSWDIIKRKNIGNNNSEKLKDSFSFFIDMAEIWELYLKSLLKRHFSNQGWIITPNHFVAYEGKNYRRALIPDIVMRKDDQVMVWDAKYKRMIFHYLDYDRADFFQIHTYISYLNQNKKVVAGGLLYPISSRFDNDRIVNNKSSTLFCAEKEGTKFAVDGIDLSIIPEAGDIEESFAIEEQKFVSRITQLIS